MGGGGVHGGGDVGDEGGEEDGVVEGVWRVGGVEEVLEMR